ncbi:hypothetical protein KIF24_06875 [Micromonospora sp. Llam7]|uniref:hypothetical protein n=1 Tax=Micromonospora tarapacensis TaxID=2835305 RepID=UPI001C83CF7C|nr:hypothetical protein [Micromonospora tarapacensis]MBX7265774.1 hypothetical protein [Micromonospora tarapacensis]
MKPVGLATEARSCLGYQMIAGRPSGAAKPVGFRSISRTGHLAGPLAEAALRGRYLRPQLAAVLADEIRPGAGPGAVALAIAGRCVAILVVNDREAATGVLLGDRLLEPEAEDSVSLWHGTSRSVLRPAEHADLIVQLQWLAATAGGLHAGQLLFPVPREPGDRLPVVPGTWTAQGPDAATLIVRITP